jgi:hypothetical protein
MRPSAPSRRLLGVDVARFGDDSSVFFPRQAVVRTDQGAQRRQHPRDRARRAQLARLARRRLLCRDTGGFGASGIDNLRLLSHMPIGTPFSRKANYPRCDNKRTEMYFAAVDWIRNGG